MIRSPSTAFALAAYGALAVLSTIQFLLAHEALLAPLVAALLVAALRAVSPAFWAKHPVLGELFRAARAAAPDVLKLARALAAAYVAARTPKETK